MAKKVSDHASLGGKARKASLSPAERQDIARKAVQARWAKAGKTPEKAENRPTSDIAMPYSMFRGPLKLGNEDVESHVLNDLRRVLTQREVVRVLSPAGRESGNLSGYLESNPLINKDLILGEVIQFRIPGTQFVAHGFEGTLLVDICTKYLEAWEQGRLKPTQEKIVIQAGIIIRACAKTGIIALIDEATGYQKIRTKHALQLKLQAFITEDMQEWAVMFTDEFWFELARLEGIKYSPRNRPLRWGKYVMMFVYDAIDKDVGRELRKKNPNPHFLQNHHQWLQKYGRQRVNDHLQRVIAIMKLCDTMEEFKNKFIHVFRVDPDQMIWEDWLRPS